MPLLAKAKIVAAIGIVHVKVTTLNKRPSRKAPPNPDRGEPPESRFVRNAGSLPERVHVFWMMEVRKDIVSEVTVVPRWGRFPHLVVLVLKNRMA